MDLRKAIQGIWRVLLIFFFIHPFNVINGQQSSLSPSSYWVFIPYLYNPGIIGSKDFSTFGINASFKGKSGSQLISGNARLSKKIPQYFSSGTSEKFKNFGIGGSVYKNYTISAKNIGLSAGCSYQLLLNKRELSFLSFGVSVKGESAKFNNDSTESGNSVRKSFRSDIDIGIYYYGTNFFTGLSFNNLLGKPLNADGFGNNAISTSRQYFFTAGYKILISKSLNMVLEPSLLIYNSDSSIRKITENIIPILKLYLEDFCFGASINSNGNISIFSQYRYPRFYVGAYCELQKKTAYFKVAPIVEFTIGMNLKKSKSRLSKISHW